MAQNLSGGCQCGQIRYEITGKPKGLAVCHCQDCQKQSSSAFGLSLNVDKADFHLRSGILKSFDWTCDSGRPKQCTFCPDCGSRIYHASEGGMSVKAGTLDDTSWLNPDSHYWTQRKQTWFDIPAGVAQCTDDG